MEIPVIDLSQLEGENRSKTMALLHEACEKWGFFQVENHGLEKKLMDKVKQLVNAHYEENLKESFYESETAKGLVNKCDIDWESSFFIWHRPASNINDIHDLSENLREMMDEYITQLIQLAEKLSQLMSENLGLDRDYIKKTFSGAKGSFCRNKDERVPGLEFSKDGEWIKIPPSKNNTIFVNTGDQLEVLSNGRYKSTLHRVMAGKEGSRLSIATFYNPAGDAIISSAPEFSYPQNYKFQDYLKLYATTKFSDKGPRFEAMKKLANGHGSLGV
ncbi:hypothetical protein OIU74_028987 [Salix koriyanagi]|uniref:Fe2OG dioxygenase domain-containing protein n=1 Tax=Salix koriyanagi TaxID=2511006 RepID=A0A9Q0VCY9_9ROSI|nr:hypothetical protein OIU74_028987 [Salix koriyanagi]